MVNMRRSRLISKSSDLFRIVFPAIIAGISDLGSSDFATDCYAGSRYGFSFLWVLVLVSLFLIFILQVTAQIGSITGKGLLQNIKAKYGLLSAVVCSFFIASTNVALIAAEIAGASAALYLLTGIEVYFWSPLVALILCLFAIKGSKPKVKLILVFISFSILIVIPAVFLSKPSIKEILSGMFSFSYSPEKDWLLTLMALIGSSVSGYTLLFETSEAAERSDGFTYLPKEYLGASIGGLMVLLVNAAIMIICASQLFPKGLIVDNIESALKVLDPLLGKMGVYLIALGVFSSALLSSTVVAVSNFRLLDEIVDDLSDMLKIRAAILHGWKVILSSATLILGPILIALGVKPLKLVIYSSALSCIFSPIPLFFVALIYNGLSIPNVGKIGVSKFFCWAITLILSAISLAGVLLSFI
ncbi:MAG: hypothetical protein DRJ30_04710 [Candidatus Methanomethylicota archaeon]|nr:MAG: hypothetical protein DRJ30_04710 [Candidatus Verstraetearchaeota archaeon]